MDSLREGRREREKGSGGDRMDSLREGRRERRGGAEGSEGVRSYNSGLYGPAVV